MTGQDLHKIYKMLSPKEAAKFKDMIEQPVNYGEANQRVPTVKEFVEIFKVKYFKPKKLSK